MTHYPTLGRDGAAYIAHCDCDWRSTNTWSWAEALGEYESHVEAPMFPFAPPTPRRLEPIPEPDSPVCWIR